MQEATLSQMERRVEESKKSWSGCPGRGGDGRGTFIHSSSFIFSPPLVVVICRFEAVWGGCTVGYTAVQYSEGRGFVGFAACHSR